MWQWIMSFLIWLSADPQAISREAPRAAGAVAVAYAQFAPDVAPTPAPTPTPTPKPGCCQDCGGKGYIVHGDGHRTSCPCPPSCKCKTASCPDGKCPPGATLTPAAPAAPAGRR